MIDVGEIQVVTVQYFTDRRWNTYTGPDQGLYFEGFCPIHKAQLVPCTCLPDITTPIEGTYVCLECEPREPVLGEPPGMHWRGSIDYARGYIGPSDDQH